MKTALNKFLLLIFSCIVSFAARAESSAELIQRGEYLTRASDCIACHTVSNGQPYAGGRIINTPSFGYLKTPNITPDNETGIGQWTADDFYRALHTGIRRDGAHLFPAFPYTSYVKMSRADVDAIYAYMRTVPPVHNAVDVNHLWGPFGLRVSMIGWNWLNFWSGEFKKNPAQSEEWNRGAYLVQGAGHCAECHTPRNSTGAMKSWTHSYRGAEIGSWYALNITGDPVKGLGSWTENEIAEYLRTGRSPEHTSSLGPMAEVVHDSL